MSVYEQMNLQTQHTIQHALITLIQQKDFSKISVRDIAVEAGVNRGTFYFHFQDKYDLLEKIENRLLDELSQKITLLEPTIVLTEARQGELSDFSKVIFHYIQQQESAFKALLSKHSDFSFAKKLRKFFMDQFLSKYTDSYILKGSTSVPNDYVAAFASSAFLGVIEHWLTTDEQDADTVAEYFIKTILLIQQI